MVRTVLKSALRFRVLVAGMAAALLVMGALEVRHMHDDVLPELADGPVLEVQTEALGLSSQEVEQYLTVPLENNLLDGILGVWDVRSDSLPGLSSVDLYFQPGTTVAHDRLLVQERLTQAFSLPNVAKPPLLIQPLSSSGRVLMVGLSSTTLEPLKLSYLARWVIKPKLSGVPGVANVAIFGQRDREIQVQVDPARLAAHHVTLAQIINTAGNAQLVSPLTYLQGSSPGTGGFLDGPNQRLEIRPVLPLGAPRALADVPITGAPGRPTLGAVSKLVQTHQPLIGDALVEGGPGLVLEVQKLPGASVPGVTRGVEQALRDLRPALSGVRIDTSFFRPQTYVARASHNITIALIVAAALALLALAALALELRAACVAFASIAVSLLSALLLLDALGYTLNALVILGLLVAIGVVVDDAADPALAIVGRLRAERGASVRDLVLDACTELRGPLGFATLIVLLTVAPVFFAEGLSARFVHPLVLAFALAVGASMVLSLTLTPALAMLVFERGRPSPREFARAVSIRAAYQRVVARTLHTPEPAVYGACVLGLAGLVAVPFLGEPARPAFKDRNVVIRWTGPPGASLNEMDRITALAGGELRSLPGVAAVGSTVGRAVSADQIVDTNTAQIYIALKPAVAYGRALAAIRAVANGTPGMSATVSTYEDDVGASVLTPASSDVVTRLYGQDYGTLARFADQLIALVPRPRGAGPARVSLPTQEPNIETTINDDAALRAEVRLGDARREASTLVSGITVGNFFEQQAVFDVVVVGVPGVRNNPNRVRDLELDTNSGDHVSLSKIGAVSVTADPIDIRHEAISRYVDVTVPAGRAGADATRGSVQRALRRLSYALGYHAEVLRGTPSDPTSHGTFLSFLAAAALGILLLLQSLFGSWRLAGALLALLPLALAGGVAVALATGDADSLASDAGLAAVFVLAVRQGVLLFTRVDRLHAAAGGGLTRELVARAASERLAPVVATAVVAGAALAPFVVAGSVAGNETTHVAAAVALGGIVSMALLTLLVLPAVRFVLGSAAAVAVAEPLSKESE